MAKVLLVEDDDASRYLAACFLRMEGHQVYEAANGHEALELFPLIEPDVVVTDLDMPILNGYGLISAVRAMNLSIPIVVTSGGGFEKLEKARLLGANAVLNKPFSPDDLVEVVERVLSRPAARSPT